MSSSLSVRGRRSYTSVFCFFLPVNADFSFCLSNLACLQLPALLIFHAIADYRVLFALNMCLNFICTKREHACGCVCVGYVVTFYEMLFDKYKSFFPSTITQHEERRKQGLLEV